MNIRMYDCGFGDCFQIDEGTGPDASHLVVDCGWKTKEYKDRLSELKSANSERERKVSFLLTHYHDDHFRGFCEMIKHSPKADWQSFDKVYIPDVWNADTDVELVALLLMSELKTGKKEKLVLIDFLIDLLEVDGVCYFTKAGDIVENRYKILWPEKTKVSAIAKENFSRVWGEDNEPWEAKELKELAKALISIVSTWNHNAFAGFNNSGTANELRRLKSIQQSYLGNIKMLGIKRTYIKLADYANNVSIVFKTHDSDEIPKVLFTGDFPKKFWDDIKPDIKDEEYVAVKVPHHGTKNYYWPELKNYFADGAKILIPNGDPRQNSWQISYKYPEDLNCGKKSYSIICFDIKACPVALGNGHKCTCGPEGGCISILNPGEKYYDIPVP